MSAIDDAATFAEDLIARRTHPLRTEETRNGVRVVEMHRPNPAFVAARVAHEIEGATVRTATEYNDPLLAGPNGDRRPGRAKEVGIVEFAGEDVELVVTATDVEIREATRDENGLPKLPSYEDYPIGLTDRQSDMLSDLYGLDGDYPGGDAD